MPKQTFFNLEKNKQKILEEAAITEFGIKGYVEASINKIIKSAQISRGSFYSYFLDKNDLYQYVITKSLVTPCRFDGDVFLKANYFDQQVLILEELIRVFKEQELLVMQFLMTSTVQQIRLFWQEIDKLILVTQKQRDTLRFQSPKDIDMLSSFRNELLWQALYGYFINHKDFTQIKSDFLKQLLFLKIGISK